MAALQFHCKRREQFIFPQLVFFRGASPLQRNTSEKTVWWVEGDGHPQGPLESRSLCSWCEGGSGPLHKLGPQTRDSEQTPWRCANRREEHRHRALETSGCREPFGLWVRKILRRGGCSAHCRMFGCVPGLSSPDAVACPPSCDSHKCLQTSSRFPQGWEGQTGPSHEPLVSGDSGHGDLNQVPAPQVQRPHQ